MSKESFRKVRNEIVQTVPLDKEMEKRGVEIFHIGSRKKAVCPFHGDTDPSLVIYEDDHPHAHCFGCGLHFDVIGFVHQWGEKFEANWDFKKTLRYFRDNYKIKSILNPNEMDNSFLEEEGYVLEAKDDVLIDRDYYRISGLIKSTLRDSPFPIFDLKKLKPFLKNIDEAAFSSDLDSFRQKEDLIKSFISKIDLARYDENMKEFSRHIMGNPDASILIVCDISAYRDMISSLIKTSKEEEVMFLISDHVESSDILSNLVSVSYINSVFIVGQEAYNAVFPNSMKSFSEFTGKSQSISVKGKVISINFKSDLKINSWMQEGNQ